MRVFIFLLLLVANLAIVYGLQLKIGQIPPVGKFLSPHHGFWQNAEKPDQRPSEQIEIPGLMDEVRVGFDEHGIPHIKANSDDDLFLAQGYLTASYRLWQMQFQAAAMSGRISEIIGKDALNYDRTQRRKGLAYAAENALKEIQKYPEYYRIMEKFSEGVNAKIRELRYKDYPIEFKLLDYEPEAWTPLHSFLLAKSLSEDLSSYEQDLENTNALAHFGREWFDLFFPDYPEGVQPIVERKKWPFKPNPIDTPKVNFPLELSTTSLEKPNPNNGSNNFAISPKKSQDGKTYLAYEPDLTLNLPSIWFAANLESPRRKVMGVSYPGIPGIIIGFTDSLAWGNTNSPRDVKDWYKITFKDEDQNEYLNDGKWLKTQKRIEEIKIKGSEIFYDTVFYTHHGPVVYDKNFHQKEGKLNFAMRWVAHDPSLELIALDRITRANNLKEVKEAFNYFSDPAQNYLFATARGDIGLAIPGKFPIKWKEQGKFLMDGSSSSFEWQEYIPKEHNVFEINPEEGFLSSANQHPFSPSYPYYFYHSKYEHYRGRVIKNTLRAKESVSLKDLKALQHNNYSLKAAEILPFMLDSLDLSQVSEEGKKIHAQLRAWDSWYQPQSKEAAYFDLWFQRIHYNLWDELRESKLPMPKPSDYNTTLLMKQFPEHEIMDIQATDKKENLKDILVLSFQEAMDSIEQWKKDHPEESLTWANFKGTTINHLLNLPAFNTGKINVGGNSGIVNAVSKRHGPSWRMIVSYGPEGVKALGVYPGGQSGNPGSHHYNNWVEAWASGEYLDLQLHKTFDAEKDSLFVQQLLPLKQ